MKLLFIQWFVFFFFFNYIIVRLHPPPPPQKKFLAPPLNRNVQQLLFSTLVFVKKSSNDIRLTLMESFHCCCFWRMILANNGLQSYKALYQWNSSFATVFVAQFPAKYWFQNYKVLHKWSSVITAVFRPFCSFVNAYLKLYQRKIFIDESF